MSRPAMRRAIAAATMVLAACSPDGATGAAPSVAPTLTSLPPATTTTTSTTVPFTPEPLPAGLTLCDLYSTEGAIGALPSARLDEVSGIAASRAHPGIYWVHNDSGDDAAVYAVDPETGTTVTFEVADTFALDWEDIALGPGPDPDADYLYVGDIGDNFEFRPDVTVYRFPEPDPATPGVVEADTLTVRYPDGSHDAESLAVDPVTAALLIATKASDGVARFYTAHWGEDDAATLELVAEVDLGAEATGADIRPDGAAIAVRGYRTVWLWYRQTPSLAATLGDPPCSMPAPTEVQGEAIAFEADGTSYVTVSEGAGSGITRVGPG